MKRAFGGKTIKFYSTVCVSATPLHRKYRFVKRLSVASSMRTLINPSVMKRGSDALFQSNRENLLLSFPSIVELRRKINFTRLKLQDFSIKNVSIVLLFAKYLTNAVACILKRIMYVEQM